MTERQKKLLLAIIKEFIESADAVASLQLMRKYKLPISSATIRNEMKFLCDAGYLRQLHTSSGRVPTTTGLRFFIDEIYDDLDEVRTLEQERIKQKIFHHRFSTEELVRESLKALVKLSGNPSFMIVGETIHYAGLADMLMIPEFQDLGRLQRLMRILEDYASIMKILNRNKSTERVKILIGDELGVRDLDDYAVVFAEVRLHGDQHGYISTIGPNRMDYSEVIPAVNYIAQLIGQAVKGW
jgi:transcriptional regulator of heat shock response